MHEELNRLECLVDVCYFGVDTAQTCDEFFRFRYVDDVAVATK